MTGALAAGSAQTVAVRDVPGRTLVELRVATNQDGSGAVESALGFDLPAAGPRTLEAPLVHRLRDSGGELSAVEVSAGFAVLELSGPRAPAVLAHGCSIDLHPRVFGRGRSARTMLAKAQVVFALTDDAPTYRIWVRSSFARYLVAWLLDAATEYLCEDPTRSSG